RLIAAFGPQDESTRGGRRWHGSTERRMPHRQFERCRSAAGDAIVETTMKIATEVPWQDRRFRIPVERIKRCETLGFDAVFTAEGVGNDALTPLGYLAAMTERMSLGTHIATATARPPTVLAQALMTIDAMAGGGRVIAGVGSGFPSSCE